VKERDRNDKPRRPPCGSLCFRERERRAWELVKDERDASTDRARAASKKSGYMRYGTAV
jgi:hypothetical protein